MKKESNINVDQLTHNEDFIGWVKHGTNDRFWTAFIDTNPHYSDQIDFAKNLILGVTTSSISPAMRLSKDNIWNKIEAQIPKEPPKNKFGNNLTAVTYALIGIGLLLIGLYLYNQHSHKTIEQQDQEKWIEYTNHSTDNWPIDLADGSQVILEPEAYLKYPLVFEQNSRKVQLTGDAFFDIAHDSLKAFYVYANEAIIRVIGTSFHVKAQEVDKDVQVIVRSGKVAVYKGKEIREYQANRSKQPKPLLVNPNQIATLNRSNLKLAKRLVTRPTLAHPLASIDKVHFRNKSINEIAQALSRAYGIEIIVNENITTNCRLTTTLTDQPLFEKLKIICDPLGLKYYEENAKIRIVGECK